MKQLNTKVPLLIVLLLFPFGLTVMGSPQDARQPETQPTPAALEAQIAELRALVMRLETALLKEHGASAMGMGRMGGKRDMSMGDAQGRSMGRMQGMSKGGKQGMSMGNKQGMPMGGKQGMSMGGKQDMSMGGMGGMSMGDSQGMSMGETQPMSMMDRMMMKGMSRMGAGTQGGSMSSAQPGFPGASHICHVGATGFFLDHSDHITLTVKQQQQLNALKELTLLSQSTRERQIEQAEQELWVLTASDRPEIGSIEAKIREEEGLRCEQRLEFIRAVCEAATVLTKEQRLQLVGQHRTASTQPAADSNH